MFRKKVTLQYPEQRPVLPPNFRGLPVLVKDQDGRDLDAVEVVARYLASLPNRTTTPRTGRLKLVKPVPAASFGSPEIQPWRGAIQSEPKPRETGAEALPVRRPQRAN